MKLTKQQHTSLTKLLYDFSRLTFAGLVLGQIALQDKFDLWIFILGIIFILVFVIIGTIIEKNGGDVE